MLTAILVVLILTNHKRLLQASSLLRLRRIRRYRRKMRLDAHLLSSVRPGRGVSKAVHKEPYVRRTLQRRYEKKRFDPCVSLFETVAHITTAEFDALYSLVRNEIETVLDPHGVFSDLQRNKLPRRPKRLSSEEMLFFFLEVLGGGCVGAMGLEEIAFNYGITKGTAWNYFCHTAWACYRCMNRHYPLVWPSEAERSAMEGLLKGFPKGVMFVDGTKQKIFRSVYHSVQNDQYDGRKKLHCYALLVYVDVYGVIRRIEITNSGRTHDKTMFCLSDVYQNKNSYFSDGQQVICDAGFMGAGSTSWIVTPFKKGQTLAWRGSWNRDVRSIRVRNEWGIGYVKNRHRVFLGTWPYSEAIFYPCIYFAAMLMNWRYKQRNTQLVPLHRMIEQLPEGERFALLYGQ